MRARTSRMHSSLLAALITRHDKNKDNTTNRTPVAIFGRHVTNLQQAARVRLALQDRGIQHTPHGSLSVRPPFYLPYDLPHHLRIQPQQAFQSAETIQPARVRGRTLTQVVTRSEQGAARILVI